MNSQQTISAVSFPFVEHMEEHKEINGTFQNINNVYMLLEKFEGFFHDMDPLKWKKS